jgi:hypothetical protein
MEITLKELTELIKAGSQSAVSVQTSNDPLVGEYVICRCYTAGVHAGELVSQQGDVAMLKSSRRLWNWKASKGVALSGVAQNGLASGCKIDSKVDLIRLTGVIETIKCSNAGSESIQNA